VWPRPSNRHFRVTVDEYQLDCLYCISSGYPDPAEVEHDLYVNCQSYCKAGETAVQDFIDERIASKQKNFYEPLKKLKLKNFEQMSVKKTVTTSKLERSSATAEKQRVSCACLPRLAN